MKQSVQYVLHKRKYYRIIYVRSVNETFKGNKMMTKSERLLEAFKNGEKLTAAQIKARFGIANPTATVSDLRFSGFAIYANQHKDTKGRVTTKYRIGNPSRAVVAAGYRALAAQKA
jgi:predicted ArsR family transcriptional regulator